jgi:hypothetical protein
MPTGNNRAAKPQDAGVAEHKTSKELTRGANPQEGWGKGRMRKKMTEKQSGQEN